MSNTYPIQHLNPRPKLLPFIVNPFSPLLLCDHHYGTEREPDPDIAFNQLYDNTTHNIQPCAMSILACWLGSMSFTKANAAFARPPSHLNTLLTQYTRDFAPLTPYVVELVAALRSMDADLANATAPILRPAGSRTVLVHPLCFSIPPEYVRAVVPAKGQGLATVIPGAPETYKYLPAPGASPAELLWRGAGAASTTWNPGARGFLEPVGMPSAAIVLPASTRIRRGVGREVIRVRYRADMP